MSSQFELDLCYCHHISIIINYVLQKQTCQVDGVKQAHVYLFYDESPFVYDTIDASKELVTYMKQTKLNKQLKNKMKQDVVTRFDGLLIMLQYVSAELDESTELLKKRKQEDRAKKIFKEVLDELIRLLHYFKLTSKSLEPFNTPTLHLVSMWLAKLKAHFQPRDEPVTVKGASGEKITIPADSEDIAPIKRPPVVKKNLVKRSRTVFVHVGPSQDDSDEESEDDVEPTEESQLEACIDQDLVEYSLFKASKSDKEVLLQSDTRKRAREDGDVKHDVGMLPWWRVKSDKFPILTHAAAAVAAEISSGPKRLDCGWMSPNA
ncbi:unnamed protein product [Sphagnum jensenii]|uniref:Uncharacterized protein n=1 Tax=Sphagnum jensenii TaxID=128206 RepID=A0ABP1BP16_9BRYO